MARLFKDLFTQWLETQGMKPAIYQPGGIMGYPPMGWQIMLRRCSISYVVRPEQPETLIVIMFERENVRSGLGSSFADFIRFVRLVKHSGAGITRIQGRVHTPEDRPSDSLEVDRMTGFYHRYLQGKAIVESADLVWTVGDLGELDLPPLPPQRQV